MLKATVGAGEGLVVALKQQCIAEMCPIDLFRLVGIWSHHLPMLAHQDSNANLAHLPAD
jgi:hypothetical protein